MEYSRVPVTWKPAIRPHFFPPNMPSTLVRGKKTASVLGISPALLYKATLIDELGLDDQHLKKRPWTYSCDQVILLMRLLKRPGQAAFERYLLAKLEREVAKGQWPHPYPDCLIMQDVLGLPLPPQRPRIFRAPVRTPARAPVGVTDEEFERAMQ